MGWLKLHQLLCVSVLAQARKSFLDPSITHVTIDIGANFHPEIPLRDDPTHAVITVEPQIPVCNWIIQQNFSPRLHVLCAAVSDRAGVQAFRAYNRKGLSSTLLGEPINGDKMESAPFSDQLTAVITLPHLLDMIPWNVTISWLKIDAQGSDFAIVVSAGTAIRRVQNIQAETWAPPADGGMQCFAMVTLRGFSCRAQ